MQPKGAIEKCVMCRVCLFVCFSAMFWRMFYRTSEVTGRNMGIKSVPNMTAGPNPASSGPDPKQPIPFRGFGLGF